MIFIPAPHTEFLQPLIVDNVGDAFRLEDVGFLFAGERRVEPLPRIGVEDRIDVLAVPIPAHDDRVAVTVELKRVNSPVYRVHIEKIFGHHVHPEA